MPVLANPSFPLNNDTVTPGFLGFGVFLALLVALVFLVRSMNKQIGKIQAPREADLKQREWERAQAASASKPKAKAESEDKSEAEVKARSGAKAPGKASDDEPAPGAGT
ncbi:hypothetical protein GCM10010191_36610 [Actinomadura vinacea]|uniref:Uncharacterized protein n=1 Tax=Actinomadura vinacea TaxID=115336 RepID=A0ABP5W7A8_9ACTN